MILRILTGSNDNISTCDSIRSFYKNSILLSNKKTFITINDLLLDENQYWIHSLEYFNDCTKQLCDGFVQKQILIRNYEKIMKLRRRSSWKGDRSLFVPSID